MVKHALSFPRQLFARVLQSRCPSEIRGRRESRAPTAPVVPVQQKARGRTTGTAETSRLSPREWFYGFLRALPGEAAFLALVLPGPRRRRHHVHEQRSLGTAARDGNPIHLCRRRDGSVGFDQGSMHRGMGPGKDALRHAGVRDQGPERLSAQFWSAGELTLLSLGGDAGKIEAV
jgi:hypothetical protein